MTFSVIIPTYNDWDRLKKCLVALVNQTISSDHFEVIVVDNNSGIVPDGFIIPKGVQIIHERVPGSYVARNTGATVAKGSILAFTDSDCIPDENWLANAEKYFKESTCDLIGGRVEIFKDANGDKYGYLYERLTAFPQHKNVPLGRGVTANLFVKKDVFEQVGGFDSSLKSGGDWEFTLKCTRQNYKMIYAEDVWVLHPARDFASIFKKIYRITCGGAVNVKEVYGHSYLRILGSHLIRGLNMKREYLVQPSAGEKIFILSIDLLKYLYRIAIHSGLILGVIDPSKARE